MDASTAVAWLLPGQSTDSSEALLSEVSEHTLVAPHIFPVEIRNALLALEWRQRLTSVQTSRAMTVLAAYGIDIDPPPPLGEYDRILDLARREHLTMNDTLYLWQAMREGIILASRDGALLAAAQRQSISIRDLRV